MGCTQKREPPKAVGGGLCGIKKVARGPLVPQDRVIGLLESFHRLAGTRPPPLRDDRNCAGPPNPHENCCWLGDLTHRSRVGKGTCR